MTNFFAVSLLGRNCGESGTACTSSRQENIVLTARDSLRVLELLEHPPKPTAALSAAAKKAAALRVSGARGHQLHTAFPISALSGIYELEDHTNNPSFEHNVSSVCPTLTTWRPSR